MVSGVVLAALSTAVVAEWEPGSECAHYNSQCYSPSCEVGAVSTQTPASRCVRFRHRRMVAHALTVVEVATTLQG